MLSEHGDWMELGSADENKPAKDGTLEHPGLVELKHNACGNRVRAR